MVSSHPVADSPSEIPAVDIVTVTYNSARHLDEYFQGLSKLDFPPDRLRLIVVDNASSDNTRDKLRSSFGALPFPAELIASNENLGFGAGCNIGARNGQAPLMLFLNPDGVVAPDSLQWLVRRAISEPRSGLIDAALEPVAIGKVWDSETGDTDWCTGAAVLARREAFDEVGGFDEFFFLYSEDVDLSWRVWLAGWRCIHEPRARVRHETTLDGIEKPITMYYSIRNSFAMRLIYDSAGGVRSHVVRGLRYLASPRTVAATRLAVLAGLWFSMRQLPHLLQRRRSARASLATCAHREHFIFSEWFYGRFVD